MQILKCFLLLLAISVSYGQRIENIEPEIAAEPVATNAKPNPQAGDAVNPRILGPGFGSLVNAGVGVAAGIAQSFLNGNRPGFQPGFQGGLNQPPHSINFGGQGGNFGTAGHFGGSPGGFNRPEFNRPGIGGGSFNRPGGFVDGHFNRPGFGGGVNRPGGFTGSNINRPGFGGSGFERPDLTGGFSGSNINRPGGIGEGGFGGNNFNRPGVNGGGGFGGNNFNRPGVNGGGGFGGNNFNRPGVIGEGGREGINNFGGNNFNRPVSASLTRPNRPPGFPEFTSSLTKPGTCPVVRPVCPDRVRIGPVFCEFDNDCKFGEKCCFDRCLEGQVCKRAL
ncbi:UNVERIFIED_CONTAM: hypothetical protein RMT77_008045 [Armadillidium vulgare]